MRFGEGKPTMLQGGGLKLDRQSHESYGKTINLIDDLSNLTGLDRAIIKEVLRGVGLMLSHYVAEEARDADSALNSFVCEIPYVGSLNVELINEYNGGRGRPPNKRIEPSVDLTYTFRKQILDAQKGKSPLEDAVVKKFTNIFIDRYRNIL